MASASKSKTLHANTGAPYTDAVLTAYFNEESTSVENNTSYILVSASQQIGNGSWSSSGASTLQIYWFDNNQNSAGKLLKSVSVNSQSAYQAISVSKHVTATHKSDGTLSGYAKAVWTKGGSSNYTPNSGSISTSNTTLTEIPRAATITNAPNFNDTQNPTITYSNQAGSYATSLQVAIYDSTGTTAYAGYRNVSTSGTTYQFNLTTTERNALLNATTTANSITVRYYIKTVIGGNTYYNYKDATFSVTNANPTFTATYQDTNSTVTAITTNNQLIVRNKSTLQINVASLSAKKGATISSVAATINGVSYSATISGTSATIAVGTINVASNTTAVVTATDSRSNTTTQNLAITVANWELPTGIITMQRQNNFYSNTDITVDGSYSSVAGKNTMTIKVREKKVGTSTWSSYTTLQDNVASTFDLDNNYEWNVQVVVSDRFGSTTYNLVLSRGLPIIYFDSLLNSVGINCFPSAQNSLELNGVPVNRNIMTYGLTSNVTTATTNAYTKVPLNNAESTGNRLTANNNGVKIGKGVTKVLVSAQMMIYANTKAGICNLAVTKNNDTTNLLAWTTQIVSAGGRQTFNISPTLVTVAENDVINICYKVPDSNDQIYGATNGSGTTGTLTWMTVEVVG